jgi:hypothetical protein
MPYAVTPYTVSPQVYGVPASAYAFGSCLGSGSFPGQGVTDQAVDAARLLQVLQLLQLLGNAGNLAPGSVPPGSALDRRLSGIEKKLDALAKGRPAPRPGGKKPPGMLPDDEAEADVAPEAVNPIDQAQRLLGDLNAQNVRNRASIRRALADLEAQAEQFGQGQRVNEGLQKQLRDILGPMPKPPG